MTGSTKKEKGDQRKVTGRKSNKILDDVPGKDDDDGEEAWV